jgi:hypothetical protein
MNRNLEGSTYGRFCINFPQNKMTGEWQAQPTGPLGKLFTFQASSPKPLGRLEPNLAGMFLGWSSTKLLFFVLVGYSILLPGPIMCSDWLKFQRSCLEWGILSGQTKDYKISICCFPVKHTALRRKSKDWLARNRGNVSEYGDISIRRLLFQWTSTIKIQISVLD